MPFNFQDVDDVVDEITEEEESSEPEAGRAELTEVQRRMKLAECYSAVFSHPMFPNSTEYSKIVEKEFKAFAITRLEELMGVRQSGTNPGAASPFTPEELSVLKQVAATVLNKAKSGTPMSLAPVQNTAPISLNPIVMPTGSTSQPKPKARPKPPKRILKDSGHKDKEGKPIMMDVTPQARPNGAIQPAPPMTEQQVMRIMQARSEPGAVGGQSGAMAQILGKLK